MVIGSLLFMYSSFPQVIKIYKIKDARAFSWQFIGFTTIAIFLQMIVIISLGLYYSGICMIIQLICSITLLGQKWHYGKVQLV